MKKYSTLMIVFSFLSIIFVTFSYSAFNNDLYVSGNGMLRAQAVVRVNSIITNEYYGSAIENFNPNYNVDRTNLSVNLPTTDSKIKYYVTIDNKGNKVFIPEIELLSDVSENVIITISDGKDTFNLPNDNLSFEINSKEDKVFTLEIYNKSGTTNDNVLVSLKYHFVYDEVTSPIIVLSDDKKSIELLSPGTSTFDVDHYEYYISESEDSVNDSTVASGSVLGNLDITNINFGSYNVWYRTVSKKGTKSSWSNMVNVERNVEITYISNGGSECEKTIAIKGNPWGNLCKSTNGDYILAGWYTDNNTFKNKISASTVASENITVYAKWVTGVALIGEARYATLQEAVTAAPNNTQTTIVLIADTSESVTINKTKNIVLDIQNFTVSNDGNKPVIENAGILSITNGTFTSNAPKNAIINNTGTINISGGNMMASGDRQVLYNNGGTATISGNAYLTSSTNQRATVHNLNNGSLTITGGTIISEGFYGVNNPISKGVLIIGNKDGNVNKNSPIIQGKTYGLNTSGDFEYHDGIIKGTTRPISNVSFAKISEDNYEIINKSEVINGVTYYTAHLGIPITLTYNANGGKVTPTSVKVEKNVPLGNLAVPTKSGHTFDGWFTEAEGGTEITASYIPTENIELFAHWTKIMVARIGTTEYGYVQDAITAAGNTQTTIELIANTSEAINIIKGQNIILDLKQYTLGNDGNPAVVTVNGNVTITNGTITSNAESAAINIKAGGNLIVDDRTRIIATGTRQAIYNTGGYVEIKEGSYLSSVTTGKPDTAVLERATVQNLDDGIIVITGGEIINTVQPAISNESTMIIGVDDGIINSTSPQIIGNTHTIHSTGTLEYYDGVFKGVNEPINGTITKQPQDSSLQEGTEVIGGVTYNTVTLN